MPRGAVVQGSKRFIYYLMLGLARAQFAKGDPVATRATLDDLIRLNPEFKSADGHLLYSEALLFLRISPLFFDGRASIMICVPR